MTMTKKTEINQTLAAKRNTEKPATTYELLGVSHEFTGEDKPSYNKAAYYHAAISSE